MLAMFPGNTKGGRRKCTAHTQRTTLQCGSVTSAFLLARATVRFFTFPKKLCLTTSVLGGRVVCGVFGAPDSQREKGRVDFFTMVASEGASSAAFPWG